MSKILINSTQPINVQTPNVGNVSIFSNALDSGNLYIKKSDGVSYPVGATSSVTPISNPLQIDITHSDLLTLISNSDLIPGMKYRIVDYRTIYEELVYVMPIFDDGSGDPTSRRMDVSTINCNIEPIIVTALSNNKLSDIAYQEDYSDHIIKYDPHLLTTEFGNPIKGYIYNRTDSKGNSIDHDYVNIDMIRFKTVEITNNMLNGVVDFDLSTGQVSGYGTTFTMDLNVGDIIAFNDFKVRVIGITSDTTMNIIIDPMISSGSTTVLTNGFNISYPIAHIQTTGCQIYTTTISSDYDSAYEQYYGQFMVSDFVKYKSIGNTPINIHINTKILRDYSLYNHMGQSYISNVVLLSISSYDVNIELSENLTILDDIVLSNITESNDSCLGNIYNSTIYHISGSSVDSINDSTVKNINDSRISGISNSLNVDLSRVTANYISYCTFYNGIYNMDLTNATHIQSGYNCNIFRNSADVFRLSYYDSNDVLTIDDVDS